MSLSPEVWQEWLPRTNGMQIVFSGLLGLPPRCAQIQMATRTLLGWKPKLLLMSTLMTLPLISKPMTQISQAALLPRCLRPTVGNRESVSRNKILSNRAIRPVAGGAWIYKQVNILLVNIIQRNVATDCTLSLRPTMMPSGNRPNVNWASIAQTLTWDL